VPVPLRQYSVQDNRTLTLGIAGAHQELNASLAVQLAATWEARAGLGSAITSAGEKRLKLLQQQVLPTEYAEGLAAAKWPGRSQVIHDEQLASKTNSSSSSLTFFLDGAHTSESMVTCAEWFAAAAGAEAIAAAAGSTSGEVNGQAGQQEQQMLRGKMQQQKLVRVLVFNCMKERDPEALLPELHASLQRVGWSVDAALFVPPDSQYAFLASSSTKQQAGLEHRDLSWQQQLRDVWEASGKVSSADAGAAGAGAGAVSTTARGLLPELPPVIEGEQQTCTSNGQCVVLSVDI
jgi:folylpolyglutamate synthase